MWVPAHSLVEGNVTADHNARELAIRAEEEQPHPVTSYKEIVRLYKESRTRLPKPHKQLSRWQQTILRRLQAGSLAHPALLHKMYPAEHENVCPFCNGDGTLAHIIRLFHNLSAHAQTPSGQVAKQSGRGSRRHSP